ncbi:cysteine protease StiP family protein [Photobacterium japonica]|uniref:cysteine protease StiP family protein n=1 Tax=Photobacterium japonica TaxID=2910235 RepID=UPI003D116BAA
MTTFSGAYSPNDITFLLKPIALDMTPVEEKERLIQSGQAHYSDMLSQEPAPSDEHLSIYAQALADGEQRLAKEVMVLALQLREQLSDRPIVLASLVRAGVPLGVMLHRALQQLGHASHHYGISIVRDRGIDDKALSDIEAKHGAESIVFVDGWTGKGAITRQLTASLSQRNGYPAKPRLVVLADPCGMAWLSASYEDWLIPFGILGAPVSGLVSRSVWSSDDYHGCVICDHLADYECSSALVDRISTLQQDIQIQTLTWQAPSETTHTALADLSQAVLTHLQADYQVDHINRIKPGIAEATRAVLRRVPDHVLVRDINDPDVKLLVHLAHKKNITVIEAGSRLGQYRATTIIKKVL